MDVFGIPVDFVLFGLTLLGVAVFHRHTLSVALAGLALIALYKLGFTGFKTGVGLPGFDNIPLTALALKQGGYDWGFLAYAVGFGGSMIWFGSSAGVALSNMYPEAKSVGLWLRHGWHVVVAYVIGFFVMVAVLDWHPNERHKIQSPNPVAGIAAGEGGGLESSGFIRDPGAITAPRQ